MSRILWWPPSTLTRWWLPRLFKGADEYCNPSIGVVVPPFGALVLFWRRGPLRTEPCEECAELDITEEQIDRMMADGEPVELEA